jgi:hypothetical protein
LNIGRLDRQGTRHEKFGLREISRAILGNAKKMQRVKIIGIFLYKFALQIGGFVQFAASAQRMRRLQRPVVVCRRHVKRPAS